MAERGASRRICSGLGIIVSSFLYIHTLASKKIPNSPIEVVGIKEIPSSSPIEGLWDLGKFQAIPVIHALGLGKIPISLEYPLVR